jgi:hypothetical protein
VNIETQIATMAIIIEVNSNEKSPSSRLTIYALAAEPSSVDLDCAANRQDDIDPIIGLLSTAIAGHKAIKQTVGA